ncbi:MAG TPA: YdcF family protein [Planctomycetota bacterium]|nr:YdcF family protein [Planctomycetota bacterium]
MNLLKSLLLPPLSLFALAAVGALLLRRKRKLGWGLIAAAAGLLLVFCTPLVAAALLRSLQREVEPWRGAAGAGAIVVIGGDFSFWAPEYGGESVGPLTLERLRYAAHLARASALPILVSGGPPKRGSCSIAAAMKQALEEDFAVEVRWVEPRSGTTRDNAQLSAQILREHGVARIALVTQAWHMPRARSAFERAGIEVVPAPTGFRGWPDLSLSSVLPSARALRESAWAVHEWGGRLWYALSG